MAYGFQYDNQNTSDGDSIAAQQARAKAAQRGAERDYRMAMKKGDYAAAQQIANEAKYGPNPYPPFSQQHHQWEAQVKAGSQPATFNYQTQQPARVQPAVSQQQGQDRNIQAQDSNRDLVNQLLAAIRGQQQQAQQSTPAQPSLVDVQLPRTPSPTLHDIGIGMGGQLSNLLTNGYTQGASQVANDINSAWGQYAQQSADNAPYRMQAETLANQLKENARQFDGTLGENKRQFDGSLGLDKDRLGLDRDRLTSQDNRFNSLLGAINGIGQGGGSQGFGGFYDSPSGQGAALPGYSLPPRQPAQSGSPQQPAPGQMTGGLAQPVQQQIGQMVGGTTGGTGLNFGSTAAAQQAMGQISHAANTAGSRNAVDYTKQFLPQAANLNLQGQIARSNESIGLANQLQGVRQQQQQTQNNRLRSISSMFGYT